MSIISGRMGGSPERDGRQQISVDARRRRRRSWAENLPRRNSALIRAGVSCVVALVEFAVILAVGLVVEALYHVVAYGMTWFTAPNLQMCLLVALLFVVSTAMRGDYRLTEYLAQRQHGARMLGVWAASCLLTLAFGFMTKSAGETSRAGLLILFLAGYAAIYSTRLALLHVARGATADGGLASRRVFLVGFEENIDGFLNRYKPENCGMNVVAAICLRDASSALDEDLQLAAATARMLLPDDIFILAPWSRTRAIEQSVTAFLRVPAQIHLGPEHVLDRFSEARIAKVGSISSLSLGGHPLNLLEIIAKRVFDVVVSLAALALLSPLLIATALLIRWDSPGPALFLQRRYGFNRETFRIYKFRTMTTMEDGRHVAQATVGDLRITRVGRLLRRFNIDELPQLINVLRGEMSLVGPRPHALAHDQLFERKIAHYARRHNVKPGITGWAQVNGLRGEIDSPEKIRQRVEHDLYYIDNWSLLLDVWILVLTIVSPKAYRNAL